MPALPTSTSFVSPLYGDDPAFVAKADAVVRGVVSATSPAEVYVVRIDNWFGEKWLGFAGKDNQDLYGWHDRSRLRIPPFVPRRVLSETHWIRQPEGGNYAITPTAGRLHKVQRSEKNLDRWVDRLLPQAALFWISGASTKSGRGAILAHLPSEGTHVAWYTGLVHDGGWRYGERTDVTVEMLNYYEQRGQ